MPNIYEDLLYRAKWGELSEAEVAMVAEELQKADREANPYTLLHILGRSGAKSYRWLVEQFLESEEDPMLAGIALKTLCDYWNMTPQYANQVIKFLRKVSWDRDDDCRLVAISIAGQYLRLHSEPTFLGELIKIYEAGDERPILREAAYSALARAMGRDWKDIPPASRSFDLVEDADPAVLREAKERLSEGRESGGPA